MSEKGWSHSGYEAVGEILRRQAGLRFNAVRIGEAERGIDDAMVRSQIESFHDYCKSLESDTALFDDLIVEVTVGETYFFRSAEQFTFVRQEALPSLLRERPPGRLVRAWSAGCASGEEAYSLAILFEQEGLSEQTSVLGTDISKSLIERARAGIYSPWSLRELPPAFIDRYFHRAGRRFVLHERFRKSVAFGYLNLVNDCVPALASGAFGMDLIFFRNVLIYFAPETIARVARALYDSLSAGGWLITAHTDPPLREHAPFKELHLPSGRYYRRTSEAPYVERRPGRAVTAKSAASAPVAARARAAAPVRSPPPSRKPAAPVRTRRPSQQAAAGDGLAQLAEALHLGDADGILRLLRKTDAEAGAHANCVRRLANTDICAAERLCAEAVTLHSLSPELHYLQAVLLQQLRMLPEAIGSARRALYLDRGFILAHLTLGALLRDTNDIHGARRAYRNAHDLASACPPDDVVSASDGEQAGRLAQIAGYLRDQLESRGNYRR